MFQNSAGNSANSEVIAYIGAITGTTALLWNFLKYYLDNRPKIAIHVVQSFVGDNKTEIRADIINNGAAALTIRKVFLEAYLNKNRRARYGVSYLLKDTADSLPAKLDAGGSLTVKTEMDDGRMWDFVQNGHPAIAVYHSRSKKPRLKFYDSIFSDSK